MNIIDKLNENQRNLEERYNSLREKKEILIANIQQTRIDEVYNVLEYIKLKASKLSPTEINILLVHCQNKLNGNIDTIFLKFDREEK